jgi:hypothetical protein
VYDVYCGGWTVNAMNATERFAVDYLRKCGLRAERFTKAETRHSDAPEFRVFQGDELLLYCEAKHVQQDEWLDEQVRRAKPRKTVSLIPTPIFNRLSGHIHSATQRFDAVNPEHRFTNLFVLVNSDRERGVADLRKVLTWNRFAKDGPDRKSHKEKLAIDLYIWRDEWQPPEKVSGCFWRNPERREVLLSLLPDKSLWEESSAPREFDPKLRDFVKRVIVPILVDKYLEQIRHGKHSASAEETPQVMGDANRAAPRLAFFD